MAVLTETQRKVLRILARANLGQENLGGHGRGPILSAARALARKGLVRNMTTSGYALTTEGREIAFAELAAWRASRATQPLPPPNEESK